MATIKESNTLTILGEFADGDDRTITLENPNRSLNLADKVDKLGAFLKESQVILGDKTGAAFVRIKSAKLARKKVTTLNI